MKVVKYSFLLTLLAVCLLFLCACTCDPAQYDWYIVDIVHDVTYINGQTVRTLTSSRVYVAQPVGISSDDVNIRFYEDGRIEFKPYDSEMLYGNYTLKHNGIQDTSFTVVFENGERIDDGYAVSFLYGNEVDFTFRGVFYIFDYTSRDTRTAEELREETRGFVEYIRRNISYFNEGVVTLSVDGGKLSSEELETDIDLFADGYAVTAVHITDNNELVILDELRDGECIFVYSDNGVVIYYVDSLPSQKPPESPVEYSIFEIFPELEYYRDNPGSTLLKLTREHYPSLAGEFNEHLYKNDPVDVASWISSLEKITFTLSEEPPYDRDEQHIQYIMHFSDVHGEYGSVIIRYECGMVKRGNEWYDCFTFPNWYGGRPTYSFSCKNYSMQGGGFGGYFSIYGIEFVEDSKQDYEYPEDHYFLTLVGDVGEITVYDGTHFYYNGSYYLVTSEKDFSYAFT